MVVENIHIALQSLAANKLRSVLTMLGIIIGVGAVIAMVSIGMGARAQIEGQFVKMGSNLLTVMPGAVSPNGMRSAAGSSSTLKMTDVQAIQKETSAVNAAVPLVTRPCQAVYGSQNWQTGVFGTTPEYSIVRKLSVVQGSFIANSDVESRSRVAVIGKTVADNLFNDSDAIGQMIRINKAPFRVIGILEEQGQTSGGADQDDQIIIPITTAQERLMGIGYIQWLIIQALDETSIDAAQEEVRAVLRKRHHLAPDVPDDFTVRSWQEMINAQLASKDTFTMLLGSVAAISLLVGGIGIMNIMLVSVTERTREIGIRKAIGAKKQDILLQFLIEAVVIGLMGGLLGVLLGIGASWMLSALGGWEIQISFWSILLAFSFSMGIGVFFGLYPAQKAAALHPIDALRYE